MSDWKDYPKKMVYKRDQARMLGLLDEDIEKMLQEVIKYGNNKGFLVYSKNLLSKIDVDLNQIYCKFINIDENIFNQIGLVKIIIQKLIDDINLKVQTQENLE